MSQGEEPPLTPSDRTACGRDSLGTNRARGPIWCSGLPPRRPAVACPPPPVVPPTGGCRPYSMAQCIPPPPLSKQP